MLTTSHPHLNLYIRGMKTSATLAINERSHQRLAQGHNVFKLGLGQSPFPVPASVVEDLRRHASEKDYLPVAGLPALRTAVAAYHLRQTGINRSGHDVMIGPGSKELMFLLQLVYFGDLVIPTPAWVSYAPQARMLGRRVEKLNTQPQNNWRVTPEQIEALCAADPTRPRLFILNYPSNPTGTTYSAIELEALAKVMRKYKIVVLSDEIYSELQFHNPPVSMAQYYPEGTIISAGLSKWCGAGGWRLGTFLFPEPMRWLLNAMVTAASETFTSTSAPIQYAAITAFEGNHDINRYLRHSRLILAKLGTWIHQRLQQSNIWSAEPAGGFYLFPIFASHRHQLAAKGIKNSRDFCEQLFVDTEVAMLPGSDFGRPPEELSVRLAYVDFDGANALSQVVSQPDQTLDDSFLFAHCDRVTTAINRLCDWLSTLS